MHTRHIALFDGQVAKYQVAKVVGTYGHARF